MPHKAEVAQRVFTEFQLENFKPFAGPECISLKPLTLIYGPNSSGKSSINQSLLLLKQTLEERAGSPEEVILPKGGFVDLGGYQEFIHGHNTKLRFAIKAVMSSPSSLGEVRVSAPAVSGEDGDFDTYGLRVAFEYDDEVNASTVSSLQLFFDDFSFPALEFKPIDIRDETITEARRDDNLIFESPDLGGLLLKLDDLSSQSTIWPRLFTEFSKGLPDRLQATRGTLERLRARRNVYSEANVAKINNDRDAESQRQLEGEERRLDNEIERLEAFLRHFDNYQFSSALRDLSDAETRGFLLSCQNFLPARALGIRPTSWLPSRRGSSAVRRGPGDEADYGEFALRTASRATLQVCRAFREVLKDIIYLGPLRQYPKREYVFVGSVGDYVGKTGEMVPHILFKRRDTLEQVNARLKACGLGYQLKVVSADRTSGLGNVFALRFIEQTTGVEVSDLDVGFGISQVLPVITQSVLSHRKILCIEQPESQIHPRLQSELASLFADCIRPPFDNRFIIETHSEHILLRLQRQIREGTLSAEDVSIVYVLPQSQGAKCLPLRLDSHGDFIDEWPHGFFEEGYREIFG